MDRAKNYKNTRTIHEPQDRATPFPGKLYNFKVHVSILADLKLNGNPGNLIVSPTKPHTQPEHMGTPSA